LAFSATGLHAAKGFGHLAQSDQQFALFAVFKNAVQQLQRVGRVLLEQLRHGFVVSSVSHCSALPCQSSQYSQARPISASWLACRLHESSKNHLRSGDGVIDSVSRTNVDAQLPNPIAAELVIAEVAQLHSVDSSVNRDLRLCVAKLTTPFHEDVFAGFASGNGESRTHMKYRL
jgi:hypothetical protein